MLNKDLWNHFKRPVLKLYSYNMCIYSDLVLTKTHPSGSMFFTGIITQYSRTQYLTQIIANHNYAGITRWNFEAFFQCRYSAVKIRVCHRKDTTDKTINYNICRLISESTLKIMGNFYYKLSYIKLQQNNYFCKNDPLKHQIPQAVSSVRGISFKVRLSSSASIDFWVSKSFFVESGSFCGSLSVLAIVILIQYSL